MNARTKIARSFAKRFGGLIAIAAAVVMVPAAIYAWGPSRTTFTIEKPADYITFNSITNNPSHGDERNFMQVREADASNETYADSIDLKPGKEYVVYMYYHNDAAANYKLTAENTQARAELPAVVPNGSNGTAANGYISADNAKPKQVWDDISFKNHSGGDIALRYVPGSSTIHSKGKVNGQTMSDDIVTSGAKLGYDALDGKVPGCHEFAGYVTFRVKADQPDFTMKKQVRKTGDKDWKKSESVKPGESVDYLVEYKNTGTTQQNDVVVKDQLPKGMQYVKGSTKVANDTNPSGKAVSDNVVTKSGINIGNYKPGANAFVMFSAKAPAEKDLEKCGANTLRNTATVDTKNGNKSDTADITVKKDCEEKPKPVYTCDKLTAKHVGDGKYNFNGSATAKDGAEIVEYKLAFGDGKTYTGSSVKDVTHTYPQDGKSYTAKLSVVVKVDGSNKTITSDACQVTIKTEKPEKPVVEKEKVCELESGDIITIKKDEYDNELHSRDLEDCQTEDTPETPETPEKPETPETPEQPEEEESITELPETGMGGNILGITGVTSLVGAISYFIASRRSIGL